MSKSLIIDVEPEVEAEVAPQKNCAKCKGGKFPKTGVMGECRMMPPQTTIHLIPFQDPITRMQGIRPQAYAGWPPVRADNYCLSWQPKSEGQH